MGAETTRETGRPAQEAGGVGAGARPLRAGNWARGMVVGMVLPNARMARVSDAKVRDYLLDPSHPDNGGKAAFFESQGFGQDEWRILAAELRNIADVGDVSARVVSKYGVKYVVDGKLTGLNGKISMIRTVWIVDDDELAPRLVTAYARTV